MLLALLALLAWQQQMNGSNAVVTWPTFIWWPTARVDEPLCDVCLSLVRAHPHPGVSALTHNAGVTPCSSRAD